MKKTIVLSLLLMMLVGCAAQGSGQQNYSPETSEIAEKNGADGFSDPIESPDSAEFSAEKEQLQHEIASISTEVNLPIWTDTIDEMWYNNYIIEYQRELPGRSFVGYADFFYFDIIEKNNKIFLKVDDGGVSMYIQITEEQLQSIPKKDTLIGFIYSFTVTSTYYYDMGIDVELGANEGEEYISISGVPNCLIIYATCDKIYKFDVI